MMESPSGTIATREFYDREGWKRTDGKLKDQVLFGIKSDGPIRAGLSRQRLERIRKELGGPGLNLLECGCGGTPATWLSDQYSHATIADFSQTGLTEAAKAMQKTGVPFTTVAADMCQLPFSDGKFDAALSAHAIYHIEDPAAQAKAFSEIMRVVKPGGTAAFVLANPFPLMFPVRFLRRLLASTPMLAPVLNRIRSKPPLPYRPMSLRWMRRQLRPWGDVQIIAYRMASTSFNQTVSETSMIGRRLWGFMSVVETRFPVLAGRLGNYVTIFVRKR